jgi:hypothetical protein
LKGEVVRFDRFGNVITNIKIDFLKGFFGKGSFEIRIGDMVFTTISKSYYESEFTCLIGSSGYLEFGYFKGSFAATKNIKKGDPVTLQA